MEKRLTKYDYIISVLIVFMLIAAAGAFFYGWKSGYSEAQTKYEEMIAKEQEEKTQGSIAYHQQHLVSFYYTVYQPYRNFQDKWFEQLQNMDRNSTTVDNGSVMKELHKTAAAKYEEASQAQIPEASPLLRQAQSSYLKSLKLFMDATASWQSKSNSYKGAELINELEKDVYFQEAKNFALTGQQQYFASIVEWNKTVNAGLQGLTMVTKPDLTVKEWNQLNLNLKNQFTAGLLVSAKQFGPYIPMDAVTRIDDFFQSGKAKKLGIDSISKALDTLLSTGAIRNGDFLENRSKYSQEDALPQLPFFTK
ncbi:hypothetical protein [Paenibacillus turpanensis]|uniref:hypothetical protein n=1 Tax=Paenibacillus turpanensis TaxID=2689078 RepID=UPI0014085B04|nr:hypothetical protein [Paenibacillus turpanensis]